MSSTGLLRSFFRKTRGKAMRPHNQTNMPEVKTGAKPATNCPGAARRGRIETYWRAYWNVQKINFPQSPAQAKPIAVMRKGRIQPPQNTRVVRMIFWRLSRRNSFHKYHRRINAGKNTACCFIKIATPKAVPETSHAMVEFFLRAINRASRPAQTKRETKWVAWPARPAALGKAERQTKMAEARSPPRFPQTLTSPLR